MNLLRVLFSFSGRINRSEYWLGYGIAYAGMAIATMTYFYFSERWRTSLFGIAMLAGFVSILSIVVKRLRDLEISAWWVPIGLMIFGIMNLPNNESMRIVSDVILFGVTVWLGAAKSMGAETRQDWYYAEGLKPVGPISHDQLITLLSSVSRPADVLVWRNGFQGWAKAGDLPQLLQEMQSSKRNRDRSGQ
jgi:uncharacterized membrane protein YhaH (DUF805 family)